MDDIVYMQGEATDQGWAYVILDKGGKAGFVPVTYIEEAKPTGPPRPASGIKPRARSMQKVRACINILTFIHGFVVYIYNGYSC